jgi:hypothetical protein
MNLRPIIIAFLLIFEFELTDTYFYYRGMASSPGVPDSYQNPVLLGLHHYGQYDTKIHNYSINEAVTAIRADWFNFYYKYRSISAVVRLRRQKNKKTVRKCKKFQFALVGAITNYGVSQRCFSQNIWQYCVKNSKVSPIGNCGGHNEEMQPRKEQIKLGGGRERYQFTQKRG